MKPLVTCLALLALTACSERALDGNDSIVVGPGQRDMAGLDLRGVDLATTKPGIDLAAPVAAPGVPCGGVQCKDNEVCCALSGAPTSKCFPPGMGMGGGCPFGPGGYRCDGPEDCDGNRRCIGTPRTEGGQDAPETTRCRMNSNMGVVVCHADGDCETGIETCQLTKSTQLGGPPISVCTF